MYSHCYIKYNFTVLQSNCFCHISSRSQLRLDAGKKNGNLFRCQNLDFFYLFSKKKCFKGYILSLPTTLQLSDVEICIFPTLLRLNVFLTEAFKFCSAMSRVWGTGQGGGEQFILNVSHDAESAGRV